MYHYITDKEFLKNMRSHCSDIVNQLVQRINNDGVLQVEAHLVGSGARNMITQNADEPVDLDYNLCILEAYEINIYDGRAIKEYVRKQFNQVLKTNHWGDCQDSTSALSTKLHSFVSGNKTRFKIDLGIVWDQVSCCHRLKHHKTGVFDFDQWNWNEIRHSSGLEHRTYTLKKHHLWNAVRDAYLDKKNLYLSRQDDDHPSFIVYTEAVNEVYYQYFG
jgi:hypothetical protein